MDRVDEGRVDGIRIGYGRGHVGRVKKGQLDGFPIVVIRVNQARVDRGRWTGRRMDRTSYRSRT